MKEQVKMQIGAIFVVGAVLGLASWAVMSMSGSLLRPSGYYSAPEAQPEILGKEGKFSNCTTIQSGELYTTDGELVTPGYDEWGYNYQGRIFNGYYCDAYRNADWCQPYIDVRLQMKWNDAWLDNKDCDEDGLLDRYYGFDSYIGSGAWLTNHQSGEYETEGGKDCHWNYFVKIVAAPADATLTGGIWYDADGTEIGEVIWGQFAVVQEVENDTCAGIHGSQYVSPVGPGLGKF